MLNTYLVLQNYTENKFSHFHTNKQSKSRCLYLVVSEDESYEHLNLSNITVRLYFNNANLRKKV